MIRQRQREAALAEESRRASVEPQHRAGMVVLAAAARRAAIRRHRVRYRVRRHRVRRHRVRAVVPASKSN